MLDNAHLVTLEGPDAIAFAQGQFSNNVAVLNDGQWQFNAWLDARGRVRGLFHLARLNAQRLVLLLRGGDARTFAAALQAFVFRTRVHITPASTQLLTSGPAQPLFTISHEKTHTVLGCGDHALVVQQHTVVDHSWCDRQVCRGWAWLPAVTHGQLLPPALSLYRLPALALDKGCYPGQEIVARMHYHGGHKQHLHRVTLSVPVNGGTRLQTPDGHGIQLLQVIPTAHGTSALAVIPDSLIKCLSPGQPLCTHQDVQLRLEERWDA